MTQILASIDDINAFLPENVAEISDGDDSQIQIDAQRVIKSQLVGTFTPVTLAGWIAPTSTPQLIRSIAARLIAAKWYGKLFSQEQTEVPEYSQQLYNEAIAMLKDIRTGVLVVIDDDDNPITGSDAGLNETDNLWPNSSTGDPVFTMGREFA